MKSNQLFYKNKVKQYLDSDINSYHYMVYYIKSYLQIGIYAPNLKFK